MVLFSLSINVFLIALNVTNLFGNIVKRIANIQIVDIILLMSITPYTLNNSFKLMENVRLVVVLRSFGYNPFSSRDI
jgi:hypothetical protein